MNYHFPELHRLADWIRQQGGDPNSFASDRHAAYVVQKLAGTRIKFPPRGVSCFEVLRQIEQKIEANPELAARSIHRRRTPKKGKKGKGGKAGRNTTPDYVGISVFTDGAAIPSPGAGGWGVVAYRDQEEVHCACGGDRNTTNNAMELLALLEALEYVLKHHPITPAKIYTDSTYARDCAMTWVDGWVKRNWRLKGDRPIANLDVIKAIYFAKQKLPNVSILWVPGHSGERGNERADELAEQGRVAGASEETAPFDPVQNKTTSGAD